jgi:hypothetical protein
METNILLFALLAGASMQNNGQAAQKSIDAYLRYTGIDKQIDASSKIAQSQVPEDAKFYLAPGLFIARSIIDRKIVFQWTFK